MAKRERMQTAYLSQEQQQRAREEIRAYFEEEREETLGMIAQQDILEMFLERIAPMVYNKALMDAKNWFDRIRENAEDDYYLLYRDDR